MKTIKVYITKQFELCQNYKIQHARQKLRENVEEYSQIPTIQKMHKQTQMLNKVDNQVTKLSHQAGRSIKPRFAHDSYNNTETYKIQNGVTCCRNED